MSTPCAATATRWPICCEGARHTRASGIGERGQHAVAGGEIASCYSVYMVAKAKLQDINDHPEILIKQIDDFARRMQQTMPPTAPGNEAPTLD